MAPYTWLVAHRELHSRRRALSAAEWPHAQRRHISGQVLFRVVSIEACWPKTVISGIDRVATWTKKTAIAGSFWPIFELTKNGKMSQIHFKISSSSQFDSMETVFDVCQKLPSWKILNSNLAKQISFAKFWINVYLKPALHRVIMASIWVDKKRRKYYQNSRFFALHNLSRRERFLKNVKSYYSINNWKSYLQSNCEILNITWNHKLCLFFLFSALSRPARYLHRYAPFWFRTVLAVAETVLTSRPNICLWLLLMTHSCLTFPSLNHSKASTTVKIWQYYFFTSIKKYKWHNY